MVAYGFGGQSEGGREPEPGENPGPGDPPRPGLTGSGLPDIPEDPSPEVLDEIVPLVYHELRTIAHRHLSARGGDASLNSTALVHEAYLKLGSQGGAIWRDRAHFFALASRVMRQVLVDRARARAAGKRGGVQRQITLEEEIIAADDQAESLLQLDDALARLASVAPRLVRVVECRFFGGMSEDEIGSVLGVTSRTVRRDWDKARLLLRSALSA